MPSSFAPPSLSFLESDRDLDFEGPTAWGGGFSPKTDRKKATFQSGEPGCDSPLDAYLGWATRFELLTPKEEIFLGQEIQVSLRALRHHLHRSGWILANLTGLVADAKHHKRIGSAGHTKSETLSQIRRLQQSSATCTAAVLAGEGQESAFSEVDSVCEKFPVRPSVYLDLLDRLKHFAEKSLQEAVTSTGSDSDFLGNHWMHADALPAFVSNAKTLERDFLRARQKLVEANLRLVVFVAKGFQHSGLSLLDLIQEGNLTLVRAAENFDPRHGCRFSTYATQHLKADLRRALDNYGRVVRIPVHVLELTRKLNHAEKHFTQTRGVAPSTADLAATLSKSIPEIVDLQTLQQPVVSLQSQAGPEGDQCLMDVLADNASWTPCAEDPLHELRTKVARLIDQSTLTERERQILQLRFGLHSGEFATVEEVAAALGLGATKTRNMEERALAQIRRAALHTAAA